MDQTKVMDGTLRAGDVVVRQRMGLLQSHGRHRGGDGQALAERVCHALPQSRRRRRERQTRAAARRPQRADARRQDHRLDPHRRNRADHHRARRQGRQGDSALAFRPPQKGARSAVFAAAGRRRGGAHRENGPSAFAEDCVGPKAEAARRRHDRTATFSVWKTPAFTPRKKKTTKTSPRSLPRSATSSSTTPSRPRTASTRRTPRS